MNIRPKSLCPASKDLLFSCSGAADVAEIGDRAVRSLHAEGADRMFCLAGIGGRVDVILEKTREATRLIAVDGCEQDCARRTLEAAGFQVSSHLRVIDLGYEKGKTAVTTELIDHVAASVRALLKFD
ncbi:MAG: putative zinc-binding protein [Bryobacteraceae bacterium]|nr:putative zinc-binding protein [Bryobacteraceae bacterium]